MTVRFVHEGKCMVEPIVSGTNRLFFVVYNTNKVRKIKRIGFYSKLVVLGFCHGNGKRLHALILHCSLKSVKAPYYTPYRIAAKTRPPLSSKLCFKSANCFCGKSLVADFGGTRGQGEHESQD
jgi:hypothetical protein